MAADWADIRDAIAARIATVDGLQPYTRNPATPTPPCAVVLPPEDNDWHTTDGSALYWLVPVRLIVSKASADNAQKRLDQYLATSGPMSVRSALRADNTLAGLVHGCEIEKMHNYQEWIYGDVPYMGAEYWLRVWG